MKIKYIAIIFLSLATMVSALAQVDHWETIIKAGDNCRYLVPTSNIGDAWKQNNFDDSNWSSGQSGVGYGDGDDNTLIASGSPSVYLRFEFTVADKSQFEALLLDMDYDDGFVAYLNGTEVARGNVPNPISWNMSLPALHEAALYKGGKPERYVLNEFIANELVNGLNTLAIEVHNESATSSDLSSNTFLHVGLSAGTQLYSNTPSWFWEPITLGGFNLPLMVINTNGQAIPDEPRIVADMGLINNGEGQLNYMNDAKNEYDGKISIERRGESSSGFAKKSYSIELQNADGTNNNISILGLPIENDFVLYGPYSDKTMVKNVLTYALFRRTGRYAPRTRYIELLLNGDYRGIYVLTEKIKRDDNRVNIDKLTSLDVDPVAISGGYLLRRDKKNDLPPEAWWTSPVQQPYHETMWYQYFDPKYDELTSAQSAYIKDWMKNFDELMSSPHFADPDFGYRGYMKVNSFIDMMFINEISKGIDNYLFSTYFYKENDADGGQLVAGPPWDYNLGYGNLNYGDDWNAKETYGWAYTQGSRVYWYERLMEHEEYQNRVFCRWSKFREDIYSDDAIIGIIDSCLNVLGPAVDRNFQKYPILGQYVWPAIEPIPQTFEGEIAQLKTWLLGRLAWMDEQWRGKGLCSTAPPTDILLSNSVVLENLPPGTLVGELSTVDPDDFDTHRYKLSGGVGDTDNASFEVIGNELYSLVEFVLSVQEFYSVRIQSKDTGGDEIEKAFTIRVDDGSILAIDELREASINLYPNPSTDWVNISFNNDYPNRRYEIEIIDMKGVVKFNGRGTLTDINNQLVSGSSSLKKGAYIIKVRTGNISKSLRFMKL